MRIYKLFAVIGTIVLLSLLGCPNDTASKDGKDGKGIVWKGSFDTAPANPEYLWAYYDITDGCSYLWNGNEWTLLSGKKETSFNVPVVQLDDDAIQTVDIQGIKTESVMNVGFITLFFLDEQKDIPYIPINNEILDNLLSSDYTVSNLTADSTQIVITNNKRKSKAVIDLTKRTCSFDNYDSFFQKYDHVYYEIASPILDYLKVTDSSSIAGQSITLDWSTQDIGMVITHNTDDEYLLAMPLQTFNDIFLTPSHNYYIYNGSYLYPSSWLSDSDMLSNNYYSTAKNTNKRSETFAKFCYNELCLNLDFHYGLKAIHGIESFPDFDTYFTCVGIKDALSSTDPLTYASAVKDVCEFYFGDGHSNYIMNSWYLGQNVKVPAIHTSAMDKNYYANGEKYHDARNNQYGSTKDNMTIPGYEVSADGKTAIVRFDSFTSNETKEYLPKDILETAATFTDNELNVYTGKLEDEYSTIVFIHKVNEKIQADSNIENVVLDLSCNGGGICHSAIFVLAWMLGECTFNISNSITGAKCWSTYKADVNMNGTFDETEDSVKNKNLYCLISPLSFSCGNMVPAVLKASDRVTILGAASAGGTAVVQHSSTADGTLFRMSSKYLMSVAKNGSTYDIDKGVEPHYYINKPKYFYDIEKLTEYIK